MTYIALFWSFFKIGLFSFGGGMAAISLIQEEVVNTHGWLSLTEYTELITLVQITPGPITVNTAIFVGLQIAGLQGALIATFGCVLPACIIVLALAWFYSKYKEGYILKGALSGLRPAIVALIASAGMTILVLALFGEEGLSAGMDSFNIFALLIFMIGLLVLRKCKKVNPIHIMLGSGIMGGILYYVLGMV